MMKYCAGLLGPTPRTPVGKSPLPRFPPSNPRRIRCIFAAGGASDSIHLLPFPRYPCSAPPCISDVTALSHSTTADQNRAIQLARYTAVLMRIDDARVVPYACTCASRHPREIHV